MPEIYSKPDYFNVINAQFFTEPEIKRPKLNDDGSFYIMYSPEQIKLRPKEITILNLKTKINLPREIERMIGLFPRFISNKLSIENSNWVSNKRNDEMIQLDILNKHFYDTINIKKNEELAYIFLVNQKSSDKIVTMKFFTLYDNF